MVSHFGSSDMGGHFIAYCKHRTLNEWYCYNDAVVTRLNDQINGYKNGVPYILFYESKQGDKNILFDLNGNNMYNNNININNMMYGNNQIPNFQINNIPMINNMNWNFYNNMNQNNFNNNIINFGYNMNNFQNQMNNNVNGINNNIQFPNNNININSIQNQPMNMNNNII